MSRSLFTCSLAVVLFVVLFNNGIASLFAVMNPRRSAIIVLVGGERRDAENPLLRRRDFIMNEWPTRYDGMRKSIA